MLNPTSSALFWSWQQYCCGQWMAWCIPSE